MSSTQAASVKNFAEDFVEQGFCSLDGIVCSEVADAIMKTVRASHPNDHSLFLTEEEWEASSKSHTHTNPRAGRNILEKIPDVMKQLEDDPRVKAALEKVIGKNYRWLYGKLVCRIAEDALPDWLRKLLKDQPSNTLNAYIRPEYRDVSYYRDIDLHQDIMDYNRLPEDNRDHRFIAFYMPLVPVSGDHSPAYLLPRSHMFGATAYQHDITDSGDGTWKYRADGKSMATSLCPITGPAGQITVWHPCTIHGAHSVKHGDSRWILRCIIAHSGEDSADCALTKANEVIDGPLFLTVDYSPGDKADKSGKVPLHETDFTRAGKAG